MPSEVGLHVFVSGRVQGVWFRKSAQEVGERLGLSGWVRNRADGRVECQVRGFEKEVEAFEIFLQIGSPQSKVSHVEILPLSEDVKLPSSFEVR